MQFPLEFNPSISSDWILKFVLVFRLFFPLFPLAMMFIFLSFLYRRPSDLSVCSFFNVCLFDHTSIVYRNIIDRIINNNNSTRDRKSNEMIFSWLYLLPCRFQSTEERKTKKIVPLCRWCSILSLFPVCYFICSCFYCCCNFRTVIRLTHFHIDTIKCA